ncbi:unnamed protein product [Discosporangium mesarthrocarpum]
MGFQKEVLRPASANAQKPVRGSTVTVHCTGYGKNRNLNEKFWSTKDPGQVRQSAEVSLILDGIALRVLLVLRHRLCIARLTCTPDYAYGPQGFPAWGIMGNSTLVFEIEVLSIN